MEFRGGVGFDVHGGAYKSSSASPQSDEDMELRRGPWTSEEDRVLYNYITCHGEGRWNSLARSAGLKRTGKSCRLRWLNYLRPDVRRGNITPEEQLLILKLHSCWGNRWSKIAQRLPGRTDNEIKNYWRTRVQKQAKQLQCDVNSKQFKDVMRYLWMPRLLERIQAANPHGDHAAVYQNHPAQLGGDRTAASGGELGQVDPGTESSGGPVSSFESSVVTQQSSPATVTTSEQVSQFDGECWSNWTEAPLPSPCGYPNLGLPDYDWWPSGDFSENLWSMEDNWVIQQQQQL